MLLTQGPRIAHLSSDAELKIGSHVAEPAMRQHGARTGLFADYRLGARCGWRSDGGCGQGGELVCPAARHRKPRQLAELVAYTGLASESRDLARAGRAEDHVPNRSRPFRARPIGDAQKLNSTTWTVKEDR